MLAYLLYRRTLVGFAQLIEKEWCSFGHMFRKRLGLGSSPWSDKERSPIFVQWMECVYQLLVQHPGAFEFTERYLLCILRHVYSCRYGNFLTDTEMKRANMRHITLSLWSRLEQPAKLRKYTNASYVPVPGPLSPIKANKASFKLWRAYLVPK
jgi:myotubularin-related protein 1/2